MTSPTLDPGFTQAFDDWLKGQIGKGATPYDLQAVLPSTGQTTGAGQLTAGMNPELQQLMQFFTTGQPGTMPGASTLGDMSKTGMPIDVMPEWQAMIDAQQRNIGQGSANLREQFASLGNLKSSPFGGAMSDYYSQTAKDQNALLGQLEAGSLESARGRQMDSSSLLTQLGGQMGQYIQGLDQSSIDRLLQEFVRTRPENSPLLGAQFGMATTFPPTYEKKGGIGQAIVGSLGDILGGLGGIFGL